MQPPRKINAQYLAGDGDKELKSQKGNKQDLQQNSSQLNYDGQKSDDPTNLSFYSEVGPIGLKNQIYNGTVTDIF